MQHVDSRPTLAAPDDDPWLWLEDIEGERALAWVAAQNARTLGRFGNGRFAADRDALAAIFDRPDNIPGITRRGGRLFNYWTDAANPKGLWRTTTQADFESGTPAWDILLDLDALAAAEGEDWIWHGAATLPGSHERAIVSLSRGGGDASVLREFDLGTKSFVGDGFALPEAKGGASWLDRDTVLLSSVFGGPEMATASGYARTVRLWRRGTDPAAAPVIFEVPATSMSAWASRDPNTSGERILFAEQIGFFDSSVHIGDRGGPRTLVDVPTDAWFHWHRGWIAVRPRTPWTIGGKTYGSDTVLGMDLDGFLDGKRDFTLLFEPLPRRSLQGFFWCAGRLILSISDNLAPVYDILTPSTDGWQRETVAGLPSIGVVDLWPLDADEEEANGDLLANSQDPLTPPTLSLLHQPAAPRILRRAPTAFDPSGLEVTQHEAISTDGASIPYVQVGPPGLTGEAPVHLSGYGGFAITQKAYYRASVGKLWLEAGGTSVTANIRGGGEFGTAWHEAGRREGKKLSHDDFAAIAADLVRRGVTRPGRIGAEGGSNGGLLIANMLTRYPERFGGLVCTIPLIDMRRYTKLLAGASWIAEYGDPDVPGDWDFLSRISAYHTAAPGQPYPPILIATTRRDDRVHPGHARKMAAKLQAMGYDAAFYEPEAGGHGYGRDNRERAEFIALAFNFLRRAVGWD